ncbi:hypothetical protein EV197_2144 [Aquimarina brevivitae]|uniref:Uncharacterized protein n=2 Tax=Aquimarina brevivitae TaxID=323412 RepID=A0A4Q7P1H4_9FLAO|nr:hypothetical protein EV197_2144 [Aquimarina brevivitae]
MFFVMSGNFCDAQDFSQIGKAKLFSYTGGIAANAVFYEGDALRDPFTYVLQGNVNFNFSGLYNVPLTFTYSNQEFNYSKPFKFNRLSLNPSYKWISAHIGDASMTFSPYTLSGHQFTGVGVDLTPNGPIKLSAMYGRLIRPVEYDPNIPENTPAYERYGYGLKASYDFEKFNVGLTFFTAKDDVNSLETEIPLEIGVTPKENLVVSVESTFKPIKNLQVNVEYATSALTENLNTEEFDGSLGPFSFLFNEKLSTSYYNALRLNMNYAIGNGSIGAGYERIDPEYKTLGAYFFNNDLENITVNTSQTIFDGKLGVQVNAGLQRNNLDNTKKSELRKIVTTINLNYTASEKTSISATYSNFQNLTNIRNQFDYINEISQYDNIDTLNFKQLSQNANVTVDHMLSSSSTKKQNLNLSLNVQDVRDLQEQAFTGAQNTLNTTRLLNSALGYTLGFPEENLSFSAAVNATFNTTTDVSSSAVGPTLVVGKKFLDNQLKTSFSSSYNTSFSEGLKQNEVLSLRCSAGYKFLRNHNINMNLVSMFRSGGASGGTNDFTATVSYSYSFASGDWKLKFNKKQKTKTPKAAKKKKVKEKGLTIIKLRYRDIIYEGNVFEVLSQIDRLRTSEVPYFKQIELNTLKKDITFLKYAAPKLINEKMIDYLAAIYHYFDFRDKFNDIVFNSVLLLKKDAARIDIDVEKKFIKLRQRVEQHQFKGIDPAQITTAMDWELTTYKKLYRQFVKERQLFVGHRWMQKQIEKIETFRDYKRRRELIRFRAINMEQAYKVYSDEQNSIPKVEAFLLMQLIEYYQELAKDKVDPNDYKLKYIAQNNN